MRVSLTPGRLAQRIGRITSQIFDSPGGARENQSNEKDRWQDAEANRFPR
jgi:hypothetical protein